MDLALFGVIVRGCIILFFLLLLEMNFSAAYRFRRTTIGTTFLYYLPGLIFLGLVNILFFLADLRIISTHEMTFMVLWHLLFYMGVLLHTIASYFFVNLFVHSENHRVYHKRMQIILGVSLLMLVAFVLFFPLIDQFTTNTLDHTNSFHTGVLHFVAILEIMLASTVVMRIKTQLGHPMDTVVNPYLSFLFTVAVFHVWELVTGSWRLIALPGEVIDIVGSLLWIIAYSFLFLAVLRFRKRSESATDKP